jgi:uncharacterized repeat protein (TIGR03803 family)
MQIFHRLRRLGAFLLLAPLCAGMQPGMAAQRTQTANVVNVVSFLAPPANLTTPVANVRGNMLLANDGNIYFASSGGGNGYGTISRLAPDGTVSVVYSFADGTDGYAPFAGLIQASDGNLYGTTYLGGTDRQGTIFKLTLGGTFTLLHTFTNDGNDPKSPYAGLVEASDGYLYGTTRLGGANNMGAIFRIATDGTFTVIHDFDGDDGRDPQGRLVVGADGQLYGTTMLGGPANRGVIYRISLAGDFQQLYAFPALGPFNELGLATNDIGANPRSGLLLAADGNFYGTAYQGGQYGNGTLYRATLNGASLDVTVVHAFMGWAFDAGFPLATPIEDAAGNLYGTSEKGGYTNLGAAWKVAPDGTASLLHSFNGSSIDGSQPYAGLLFAFGSLYAATDRDTIPGYGLGSIVKLEEQDSSGVLPVDIQISATQITGGDSVTITWNAPTETGCAKFGPLNWNESTDPTSPNYGTGLTGSTTLTPDVGIYSFGLACTDAAGVIHNGYVGLIVNAPPQKPVDGGEIIGGGALGWPLLALFAALLMYKLRRETRSSCP